MKRGWRPKTRLVMSSILSAVTAIFLFIDLLALIVGVFDMTSILLALLLVWNIREARRAWKEIPDA